MPLPVIKTAVLNNITDVGHTLRSNEVDRMVRSAPQEAQRLRHSKHLQQTLERAMAWKVHDERIGSGHPGNGMRGKHRGGKTHNLHN